MFGGSDPDEITAWIYEILDIFTACHVNERIFKTLVGIQLRGNALEWWIRKQGTPKHDNLSKMFTALMDRYMTATPDRTETLLLM